MGQKGNDPYFLRQTSAAPLAVFRILFGLMLFLSMGRFWLKGWIYELYIAPRYFFSFYGFEWITPWGGYTYLLFAMGMISALMVMLGYYYRLAAILLFLCFTYIELMDKTTYLNHYYFVSLVSFIMMFLPAHVYFSIDAYRNAKIRCGTVPQWCIDSLKLLVFILYFYAGLAKLNSDWLVHALPLRIWLPARNDMPIIGFLFNYDWIPYLFSWFGCIYDLTIVFWLLNAKTRLVAYATVVVFHLLTALLFPIGMFPYVMIVTALIFFSPEFHQKSIQRLGKWVRYPTDLLFTSKPYVYQPVSQKLLLSGFTVFFVFQLLFPFRYLCYPGELFWTEQGYRFSWRVMLMEKAGSAQFLVKGRRGKLVYVNNTDFLTVLQEKMMATQPDMILQYAHILENYYTKQGYDSPQVFVDSYVSMNGRLGKPLIDPKTDLAQEKESFANKPWILPLQDEIKGF